MLIIIASCTPKENKTKNKFITIINQAPKNKQSFKYIDNIGNSEYVNFSKDTLTILSEQPITAYSYKSRNDVKYYFINSSDTVYIKSLKGNTVLFSKDSKNNDLLNLMGKLSFSLGSINFSQKLDYNTGKQQIDSVYHLKNNLIKQYGEDIENIAFVKRFVDYDRYTSLLALNTKFKKKNKIFEEALQNVLTIDTNLLTFKLFINNYNTYIASTKNFNVLAYFEKVKNSYPTIVKSYILFDLIKSYQPNNEKKLDTLKTLINNYALVANSRSQINFLKKSIEKIIADKAANKDANIQVLSASINQKLELNAILNKYRGKVVYMDIWASWCIPCIAEMPYSKSLYAEMKAKSIPVEFLYISEDENIAPWLTKSKQIKLPTERNFLFLKNDALKQFFELHQIKSIPRYLLFNKKGEIINSDALRPSDNDLKKLLIKLSAE